MYDSDATEGADSGAPLPRPRAHVWGTAADRALLQAVVEDITRRSGFKVCAMEVLRSDLMLEFVAIAGSPAGSDRLMGQGSPLSSMQAVFAAGAEHGGWLFVDSEQLEEGTREVMAEYGHQPELDPLDADDAWQASDMFFHLLRGVRGDLRGVLYLDEPHTGLRPRRKDVDALNEEIGLAVRSIVNTIEREMFGEQVLMVEAARDVIRTARSRVGVEELTQLAATELPGAFRADLVSVTLVDERPAGWEDMVEVIVEATQRVWEQGGEIIVEPDHVWGDEEFAQQHGDAFREQLATYGIVTSALIPIGMGEELLGVLSMARGEGRQRWTDSEILGAHAVAMDIAGALVDARAVAQQARLNEELRALDDYRLSMISTIAHELRNPVGVLVGHLDLIGMTGVPPRMERSLQAMERASDRIETMATSLVALGKVTDAAQPLVPVEVPLSSLVVEVLDFVQVLADGAEVGVRRHVEPGLDVQGDPAELQRLVSNLVSNALKYTPAGGSVEVRLSAEGDDSVVLAVSDTGMGIAADEVEQLFKPFFRSADNRARAKPGMGLGLAIAQRVVDRHAGTIEVASELGSGATFTVRLPRG